jgi:hypothetical protein
VNGLNSSGFDEIAIDDFADSGGKNDQAINQTLSADVQTTLSRELAIITLIYDGVVA